MSTTEDEMTEAPEPPAEASPTADLEQVVRLVVDRINDGSLSFGDLLKHLAPPPPTPVVPAHAPVPAHITDEQRLAINKLDTVFGKVVPTDRRKLQPVEVTALVEEKRTLDQLKKLAEDRHEGMRTTIFNHLDIEAEEAGVASDTTPRDKRGHYVLPGEALGAPGTGKRFTREVREGSPSLDAEALKKLVGSLDFTNDDYLEMTTQTRLVDEHKVMLALKKKPSLIQVIKAATRRSEPTAAINLRNEQR